MKKYLAIVLAAVLALCLCACSKPAEESTTAAEETTAGEVVENPDETEFKYPEYEEVEVMDYEAYIAAELDSLVCVETYVQAKQSWWDNSVTVYTQSEDGAYFLYNMPCTEEDNEKLTVGTKIKVTGYKSEFSGEIEITDAKFEILDAEPFTAEAKDVTDIYGKETDMNKLIAVKGAKVVAKGDDGAAFLYKWDGSGTQGDDIYFDVEIGGTVYTVTVESYLCDKDSEVYKAVEALKVDQVIDFEGFLYWYEGPQTHVTNVTVAA